MNILTQEIQVKFLKVLDMVSTSIHDRIDYRCLVSTLMSDDLAMFDESDKQLTEAKNTYEVLKVIRPHCSYFNYELLIEITVWF